jgi:hypothetical protein
MESEPEANKPTCVAEFNDQPVVREAIQPDPAPRSATWRSP